jgi:hypothetical protein
MQCPLEIRNSLSVIVYDNQPVDWSPQYVEDSKVSISLPPGRHTFIIPYYESAQNITVRLTATIRQEFLPGHSYRIYEQKFWLLFLTITNIKIKDVTPKDKK